MLAGETGSVVVGRGTAKIEMEVGINPVKREGPGRRIIDQSGASRSLLIPEKEVAIPIVLVCDGEIVATTLRAARRGCNNRFGRIARQFRPAVDYIIVSASSNPPTR